MCYFAGINQAHWLHLCSEDLVAKNYLVFGGGANAF